MAHSSGRVFDWDSWNDEAYKRIDHWRNKFDRGECVAITGNPTPPPTGAPDTTKYCPKIKDIVFAKCTSIDVFFRKG
jgi:hypothetical protein